MTLINQMFRMFVALLFVSITVVNAYSGTISGISVSEGSLETTTSTTYTFTFTPPTTINSSNWSDGAYFWFDFDDDYTVSSATLGSITPSISGMSINNRNDGNGQIRMYSSSGGISGGQEYVVVLNNVQNPPTAQTPDAHQIRTGDGASTIDSGSVTANDITAASSNPPVVSSQIPDKSDLYESEGTIQYISNLNNHFTDGDGDTIIFSASSSDSTTVGVSTSGTDGRILSIQANKYGSADITVTATTIDGSVNDVFTVTTIGELPISSVSEGSLETTATTSYTFVFTPESTVNSSNWTDGAYFTFDFDDDFTVSSSTLGSISPSISGMGINSRNDTSGTIRLYTNSGAISGGQQYTVVLNNVQNPTSAQTPIDHEISTGDGGEVIDIGTIAASMITTAATNPPVVSSQIPDKVDLYESEGTIEYINDLNNNFSDSDGDTITFSASSSDSTTVGVSTSGTNGRTLSIQANKYGSADITVTATTTDGSVNDIFTVATIGDLPISSVSEESVETSESTSYTFTFTPESTINSSNWTDGAYFVVDFDDDYTVSGATLGSVSPPVNGMSLSNANDTNGQITLFTNTGEITGGVEYTVVLNNVQNPSTIQTPLDHQISTGDGSGTMDIGSIAASSIIAADYSVTYYGNENTSGNVPTDSNSYLTGDTVTVKSNSGNLTRTGYTFYRWNTLANGLGTSYVAGETFTMGLDDVSLFAQWTLNPTYSISYSGNGNTGGNPPTDSNLYEQNDTVTVLENTSDLTLDGYEFTGWNTASDGTGTPYSPGETFNIGGGNVILYAQWEKSSKWAIFLPAILSSQH